VIVNGIRTRRLREQFTPGKIGAVFLVIVGVFHFVEKI